MEFMIAVFKSRREAIAFGSNMQRRGARVSAINTPLRIASSCGLSIKFRRRDLHIAQRVLSANDYFTFIGFFTL